MIRSGKKAKRNLDCLLFKQICCIHVQRSGENDSPENGGDGCHRPKESFLDELQIAYVSTRGNMSPGVTVGITGVFGVAYGQQWSSEAQTNELNQFLDTYNLRIEGYI